MRTKLGLPEFKKNGGGKAWTLISEHIYYDQHGERFLKVRKCRDGDGKKQYPQYHWDGNGWAKGKPDEAKIPYRLPQLIAAPTATIVYFVEGEKDADTLAKLGFVATTASEGAAAKWDSALTALFQGSSRRNPARCRSARPRACAEGRQGNQRRCRVGADSRISIPSGTTARDVSNWLWTIPPARG